MRLRYYGRSLFRRRTFVKSRVYLPCLRVTRYFSLFARCFYSVYARTLPNAVWLFNRLWRPSTILTRTPNFGYRAKRIPDITTTRFLCFQLRVYVPAANRILTGTSFRFTQ